MAATSLDKRSQLTGKFGTTTTASLSLSNPLLLSSSTATSSSLKTASHSTSSGRQLASQTSGLSAQKSTLAGHTSLLSHSTTSLSRQTSLSGPAGLSSSPATSSSTSLGSVRPQTSQGLLTSTKTSPENLLPHTTSLLSSRLSTTSGVSLKSKPASSTVGLSSTPGLSGGTRSSLLQTSSLKPSSSLLTSGQSLVSSGKLSTSSRSASSLLNTSLLTSGSLRSSHGSTVTSNATARPSLTSSSLASSTLTSEKASSLGQPSLVRSLVPSATLQPKIAPLKTKNLLFTTTSLKGKQPTRSKKDGSTRLHGLTQKSSVSKPAATKSLLPTSAVPKLGKLSSTVPLRSVTEKKQQSLLKSSTERKVAAETKSHDQPTGTPFVGKSAERPQYSFSSERPASSHKEISFLPPELDASVQGPPPPIVDIVGLKTTLINSVATSLLCSPDFHSSKDTTRRSLVHLGEKLAHHDPEFILKLALYTRCDLNIRTTANFLLALAANMQNCRPFLKKYFSSSIRLPSDWIEVAEIYQAFHDTSIKFGALPTALRKVMATRFMKFDAYQLAKYNKDSSKKKKKKGPEKAGGKDDKSRDKAGKSSQQPSRTSTSESQKQTSDDSDSDDDSSIVKSDTESPEELERLSFTLKQLIRKIHICEPVEYVMSLVGKRYPEDPEAFRKSRLPGVWDQERAGKRMKLPTPETWETQVSTKGNKAKTWEDLIDHNKLPFMAMLRNLRNLILAGVSQKHHQWAIRKLNDERAVTNSRQFPFRFFSAYEVLGELEKIADGIMPPKRQPKGAKGKSKKPPKELPKVDKSLLQRYRTALDNALKIATNYNVKPIPGSTLILCNVGSNMNRPCTSARGLGKPRTVLEVGILLGLMCKYSCEHCTMIIYGEHNFAEIQLQEGTILHNMEQVMSTATSQGLTANSGVIPSQFLHDMLIDRVHVDNLMVLSDTMNLADHEGREMLDFLKKYRHLVNPNLLFVSVDLSGRSSGVSSTIKPEHENDIFLAGFSDQILRFIAERGDSGQLTYVDNIDKAYNLDEIKLPSLDTATSGQPAETASLGRERALLSAGSQQKWRTVRVFISSTFRDMHGERDLLTRFVFPELRARAHSRQIKVYELDLRWGVTEEQARSNKALEICLGEISRCQYFVGLLGQRYGWIQDNYDVPDSPEFDWLKDFPPRRSITEIEMHHAALCDLDKAVGKAFFYFRDFSRLSDVPKECQSHFWSESEEASTKIESLKDKIRHSGLEVYDNYPCKWLGVVDGKPMAGGLEDFGQRVLHNLWNAIQKDYPEDDLLEDPIAQATALHEAFEESRASTFVGRKALLKKAQEAVENEAGGLVLLAGKPGSGKSAFMAAFAQHFARTDGCKSRDMVITHFIGAAPDSTNIASLLNRLCHEMKRRFNLSTEVPGDYHKLVKEWPEFLEESITASGKGSKLLILIDGIDLLEDKHNGRSMEWLPDKIPEGVVILVSGVEDGSCVSLLRKRQSAPSQVTIGALDMWDKAEMVRKTLVKHRKALDETPFNNQMKLLLSKKDANNPLYLHLACEELRVFGIFEQVTSFLKKMPPALSNLLQEILTRLEMEHDHDLVSTSLALLSLVRNGLLEDELADVLGNYFVEKEGKDPSSIDAVLPGMVISRLLRSLQGFLQPTGQENSNLLSLAHKDIGKAVRSRYMRGAASSKEKSYHQLLASYFKAEADPNGDKTFKSNSARAFSELPYHLMAAGEWKELEEVLCNIHFVVAKCQLGLAQQLLEDYTPSASELPSGKARELARFVQQPKVQEYRSFVSRNLHVLLSNPSLTLQQAVNESDVSLIAKTAREILKESPRPLMTWLNKSNQSDPCQMKITSHTGPVTCVAVSQDSTFFAAGFKSSLVKLYRVSTGKEIHTFIGHASGITSVCFVGSHAVCSASHDSTLSLWDVKNGFRVAVLKGHSRAVHGCVANQSGTTIASVSWDRSIKVWDGKTGKIQSTLQTKGQHNTPINCVSFHPEGQLVAVGSWDTTVKIWDTFNQKRLKVLKGHKSSVQACAYAPSGRHIVSAALDGEVKIWSTKSGSAVGTITGHHSPVNSLTFTPNGQYLAMASSDKLVKVWSGSLGQPVISMGSSEHGVAHCLAFDAATQMVRVGYHDGHVRKFNIHTGFEVFSAKLHSAAVVGLAYQEKLHMSASVDKTMKVWSPSTLPKCLELVGHDSPITCAVWDKKGFASASEDFTVLIWPHKAQDYMRQLQRMTSPASKVQKSRKGKSKNEDTTVQDFTMKPTATIRSGHTGRITSIAFSCDGLKMVTVSRDMSIAVWETFSYKMIHVLHACHKDWINTCCFSDTSSNLLITGSNDLTLKLWDLKTRTPRITFKGHTSSINSVAFSQGCVVSAAYDGSVKVWTHKGVEITTLHCHKQRVNACFINIPGKSESGSSDWADIVSEEEQEETKAMKTKLDEISVVTASDDGTVGVWKPFLPNQITSLVGHSDRVLSVAATVNNAILSSSMDGAVQLWTPDLSLSLKDSLVGHNGPITSSSCAVVSQELTYLVTGGRDGYAIVWSVRLDSEGRQRLEKVYQIKDSEKAVSSVCFINFNSTSQQGTISVGRDDGSLTTYKFTPTEYPSVDSTLSAGMLMGGHPISKLVLSPDRNNIIAGSWSSRVAAVGNNKKVSLRMDKHRSWVMDLIVTRKEGKSSSVVYSIALDGTLCEWEVPADKPRPGAQVDTSAKEYLAVYADSDEKDRPWMLAMSKVVCGGAPYLAIGDSKGNVYLWNAALKKTDLKKRLHQKAIHSVAKTPRGELVTGSEDGTIKLWNVGRKNGRPSLTQVGQFHCQSGVTSITVVNCSQDASKNAKPLLFVGDQLGHVTLLQWHQ